MPFARYNRILPCLYCSKKVIWFRFSMLLAVEVSVPAKITELFGSGFGLRHAWLRGFVIQIIFLLVVNLEKAHTCWNVGAFLHGGPSSNSGSLCASLLLSEKPSGSVSGSDWVQLLDYFTQEHKELQMLSAYVCINRGTFACFETGWPWCRWDESANL